MPERHEAENIKTNRKMKIQDIQSLSLSFLCVIHLWPQIIVHTPKGERRKPPLHQIALVPCWLCHAVPSVRIQFIFIYDFGISSYNLPCTGLRWRERTQRTHSTTGRPVWIQQAKPKKKKHKY